ncbi:MAG: putative ABC transporter ATP-binding protein YxlF [Candidatus Latescibacteria bacterium ADurb.Bin168]|nr:MAG: putative ABC transporter ATP-binding protein YxlF [Candidatus Latescibacteria bacterium ADurb.Bin168]
MIEVRGLTKKYGTFTAVDDISFTVQKGQILGFLGPNGAGKTTTMRILTGYLPPTSGTALVAGYDVQEQSMEVRKRIGYLPESPPLYNDMTVREYVDFCAALKGVPGSKREEAVSATLEKCGLEDRVNQLIGTLSKGYRQRTGLAQALVHDPEVLILDEPTIGLDPAQIIEIRELIKALAGNHTVILSTHILPEVSVTCQAVAIIHQGKLCAADSLENLTRVHGESLEEIFLRVISSDVEEAAA